MHHVHILSIDLKMVH